LHTLLVYADKYRSHQFLRQELINGQSGNPGQACTIPPEQLPALLAELDKDMAEIRFNMVKTAFFMSVLCAGVALLAVNPLAAFGLLIVGTVYAAQKRYRAVKRISAMPDVAKRLDRAVNPPQDCCFGAGFFSRKPARLKPLPTATGVSDVAEAAQNDQAIHNNDLTAWRSPALVA
jgi:hypothetical protein